MSSDGSHRIGTTHSEETKELISKRLKETAEAWHVSKWERHKAISVLKKMATYMDKGKYNSIEKCCRAVKLHRDLFFTYWPKTRFKDDPEVLELIDMVRFASEARVVESGLDGTFNATFAKFYLSNKFGYKDASDVNLQNNGGAFEPGTNKITVKVSAIPKSKLKEDAGTE